MMLQLIDKRQKVIGIPKFREAIGKAVSKLCQLPIVKTGRLQLIKKSPRMLRGDFYPS